MDSQVAKLEFDGKKKRFSRLEAVRYLFYKFVNETCCELVLFDPVTSTYYKPEVIDANDPNFRVDIDYFLRITSKSEKQFTLNVTIEDNTENISINVQQVKVSYLPIKSFFFQ